MPDAHAYQLLYAFLISATEDVGGIYTKVFSILINLKIISRVLPDTDLACVENIRHQDLYFSRRPNIQNHKKGELLNQDQFLFIKVNPRTVTINWHQVKYFLIKFMV